MRAGRRDRRITLQNPTDSHGSMGGVIQSYSDSATVWAEKRDAGGKEFLAADGLLGETITIFNICWRSDVTNKTRISYGSSVYDVQNLKELGRREGLELTCKLRK